MISIEEASDLLDQIAEEIPTDFWKELNGGVNLLPDCKQSENALSNDLYTLGHYIMHPAMGRYINIYYGSFQQVYGSCTAEQMQQHLRKVLLHELTHHLESLAGERGLEIKDELQMKAYRDAHKDSM